MIKVSILMLTYNHEHYIDDAVRGVLRQECDFPYELVIADDCSTDGTGTRCRYWQEQFPDRIRLIANPKNIGMARNFVQSYETLRGEYVAICEGDDWWCHRKKLQRQVDWLDAHPDFSCCFHRVINYHPENGAKSLSNGQKIGRGDSTILDLARSNYISNVSSVFRRGLFGPLPEWFNDVSTYDFALHMLNAGHGPIHYMSAPMAVYRQHRSAIWSRSGAEKRSMIFCRIRRHVLDYYIPTGRHDVCEALRRNYLWGVAGLLRHYDREETPAGRTKERSPAGRSLYPTRHTTHPDRGRAARNTHLARPPSAPFRPHQAAPLPLLAGNPYPTIAPHPPAPPDTLRNPAALWRSWKKASIQDMQYFQGKHAVLFGETCGTFSHCLQSFSEPEPASAYKTPIYPTVSSPNLSLL